MAANPTARLLRKHYRAHERAWQRAMTDLFVLYRVCDALRNKLGDEGLRHWVRVHCPDLPWDRLQELFAQARSQRLQGIERDLARN